MWWWGGGLQLSGKFFFTDINYHLDTLPIIVMRITNSHEGQNNCSCSVLHSIMTVVSPPPPNMKLVNRSKSLKMLKWNYTCIHTHTSTLTHQTCYTASQSSQGFLTHISIYSLKITYIGQEAILTKTYQPTYMPLQGGASILCVYTGFLPQSIYKHYYKVREDIFPRASISSSH